MIDKDSNYQQQGDVLIFDEKKLPKGLTRIGEMNRGRLIVAEGEATGHMHAISEVDKVEMWKDDEGTIWLNVKEAVDLEHEEHGVQTLEPGVKRIGTVKEVDPFSEEVRRVTD